MPIVDTFREETVRMVHLDLQDPQDKDLWDLLDLQDLRDLQDLQEKDLRDLLVLQEQRAQTDKLVQPVLLETLAGMASRADLAPMEHQGRKALVGTRAT